MINTHFNAPIAKWKGTGLQNQHSKVRIFVGVQNREDIMKVKFRDNHLIFRTSVEEMMEVIIEIAKNDGDEEEAIEILEKRGWAVEDIKKFDEMWSEVAENIELSEIESTDEVYKIAKNNMDLTKFWSMK